MWNHILDNGGLRGLRGLHVPRGPRGLRVLGRLRDRRRGYHFRLDRHCRRGRHDYRGHLRRHQLHRRDNGSLH